MPLAVSYCTVHRFTTSCYANRYWRHPAVPNHYRASLSALQAFTHYFNHRYQQSTIRASRPLSVSVQWPLLKVPGFSFSAISSAQRQQTWPDAITTGRPVCTATAKTASLDSQSSFARTMNSVVGASKNSTQESTDVNSRRLYSLCS